MFFRPSSHTLDASTALVNGTFPLLAAPHHQALTLVKIEGERQTARRLAEMGLTPGVEVQVLQDGGGPVLLAVRGARLAVGRNMARNILVSAGSEPA